MNLIISQSSSAGYSQRSLENIVHSDLTLYMLNEEGSLPDAGLKAQARAKLVESYLGNNPYIEAARVAKEIDSRGLGSVVMNVTGLNIRELDRQGLDQYDINEWMVRFLDGLAHEVNLVCVRSGGQSGAEVSALVAAITLSIKAHAHYPMGYTSKNLSGNDNNFSPDEIVKDLVNYSEYCLEYFTALSESGPSSVESGSSSDFGSCDAGNVSLLVEDSTGGRPGAQIAKSTEPELGSIQQVLVVDIQEVQVEKPTNLKEGPMPAVPVGRKLISKGGRTSNETGEKFLF